MQFKHVPFKHVPFWNTPLKITSRIFIILQNLFNRNNSQKKGWQDDASTLRWTDRLSLRPHEALDYLRVARNEPKSPFGGSFWPFSALRPCFAPAKLRPQSAKCLKKPLAERCCAFFQRQIFFKTTKLPQTILAYYQGRWGSIGENLPWKNGSGSFHA